MSARLAVPVLILMCPSFIQASPVGQDEHPPRALPTAPAEDPSFEPRKLDAQEQAKVDAEVLGSAKNPIRCEGPRGERAYLRRLRCPSKEPPTLKRGGSTGPGPYGTVLDVYNLTCSGSQESTSVHMDMYHDGFQETRPINGFSIEPPPKGAGERGRIPRMTR